MGYGEGETACMFLSSLYQEKMEYALTLSLIAYEVKWLITAGALYKTEELQRKRLKIIPWKQYIAPWKWLQRELELGPTFPEESAKTLCFNFVSFAVWCCLFESSWSLIFFFYF